MAYVERTDEEIIAAMDRKQFIMRQVSQGIPIRITPSITSIPRASPNDPRVKELLVKMIREYSRKIDHDPIEYLAENS